MSEPPQSNQILIAGDYTTLSQQAAKQLNKSGFKTVYLRGKKPVEDYLQQTDAYRAVIVDGDKGSNELGLQFKNAVVSGKAHPLLILTAQFRRTMMALALQTGFDEFLAKPIGAKEIIALIAEKRNNNN